MTYTLYGSKTSPFVRRTRMLLEHIPYTFKEMDIFKAEDAKPLSEINPLNQIPVFQDGDQKILDSRQIFSYLNQKHQLQAMSWDDENLLTTIDGAINSGVSLILMKRSGMSWDMEKMFIRRQHERIESVLSYLRPWTEKNGQAWNIHSMSLYSFLDWAQFREIITPKAGAEYQGFLRAHADRSIVKLTDLPRT